MPRDAVKAGFRVLRFFFLDPFQKNIKYYFLLTAASRVKSSDIL
jgi:hypothetical protein